MTKQLLSFSLFLFLGFSSFAGTPPSVCSGASIQLQPAKTDADKYIWLPKDGLDDSTKKNPTFTFTNSGITNIVKDYVVKAIKGNDTTIENIKVTVYPLPTAADFTVPSTSVCSGTSINLATTNNGYDYNWDFGDGSKASGASINHTFTSVGDGTKTFSITLYTTDKTTKCTKGLTKQYTIKQEPDATLNDYTSKTAFTNCEGGTYDLTIDNTSTTTNTNYSIDWGDGSPLLSSTALALTGTTHHYSTQGYFTIKETIIGQNTCIATKKFVVFNGTNPAVTFGNPGGTVGHCVSYDITAPITGIQSNPSGTTYTFSTNENSSVAVYGQDTLPSDYIYRFTTSSYGAIGGTMPNSFYLKVTAENPCGISYSTIEPITTSIKPKADMQVLPDTINCVNSEVSFIDKSTSGVMVDGKGQVDLTTLSNWNVSPTTGWSVSSGSLGLATPTKNPLTWGSKTLGLTFSVAGTYFVSRIVRNNCGNDTVTKTVCIQSPILPSFTVNNVEGCVPLSLKTNNTSSPIDECESSTFNWSVTYLSSFCGISSSYTYVNKTTKSSKNPELSFDKAGTYTLTLSAKNRCGIFPVKQTIKVKDKPSISIAKINDMCGPAPIVISPKATVVNCGNSPTLQYAWTFDGGTPSTSTSDLPGSVSFSPLGLHAVTLTVSNECGDSIAKTSFTIVEPPTVNAGVDTAICKGLSTILHGSATKGKLPYSYKWSANPIGFTSKIQSPTVTPLITTQYSLVVTDTVGCSGTSQVTVTINPIPTITVTPVTVCLGEKANLTAQGADTYKWSTGDATIQIEVLPTITNSYFVTGTQAGCTNTAKGLVTVNALPIVKAGSDITFCNQAIAQTLTGYSPLGGAWSGSGVTATGDFTPFAEGSFPLVYSYTNAVTNCKNTDTLIATVIKPQDVDAGIGFSVCENDSVKTLTGFKPATNGTWTGAGITGTKFNPKVAGVGVHTITYSYGAGSCIKTSSIDVTVKASPKLAVNSPIICFGDSVTLTASGADTYSWSPSTSLSANSGSSVTAKPQSTEIISIIGNSANGCSDTIISTIKVNTLPLVDAGNDQIFCNQNIPVQINAITPKVGGSWNGKGITSTGLFNPSIAQSGTTYLTLKYTDGNNCTNKDSIKVTVSDVKTADAGTGFSICKNALPVGLVGYSPLSVGMWTGAGLTDTIFNPTNVVEGIHVLTYSVGAGTCLSSDTIIITVKAVPSLTVNSPTICFGDSVKLIVQGADVYSWSPSTNLSAVTGVNIFAKPSITTVYAVTGTNLVTACFDSKTSTITVNQLPTVDAGIDQSFCNQNIPFQLSNFVPSSGGVWTGLGVNSSGVYTPSLAAIGSSYLKLTFTDGNGCINQDSLLATVKAPVFADAGTGFSICVDASPKALSGFSPANGIWTGLGLTGTIFTPSIAGIGTHVLTYTVGENTCLTSDTIMVNVHSLPTVTVNKGAICNGKSATLIASGADTYMWSPNINLSAIIGKTINANPSTNTVYIVTGTDALTGCSNSATSIVTVNQLPTVDAGADQTFCNQNIPFQLSGYYPSSGSIWSGTGVNSSGVFTPSIAGIGTNYLKLTYTDINGCLNSDSLLATVTAPVLADAGNGFAICIDAPAKALMAFNPAGGIWTGDGLLGTIFNPTIANVGTHILTYSVGEKTCLTSDTIQIKVNALPTIIVGENDTSCISSVPYNLLGYSPLGGIWSGNGIADGINADFSPKLAGVGTAIVTYSYTDTITGCINSTNKEIIVGALPNISFNVPSIACSKTVIAFNNTSTGANSFNWDFGDENSMSVANPSHTFDTAGYYTISVIAKSNLGCIDSLKKTIEVINSPEAKFTQTPSSGCAPLIVNSTNTSVGKYLSYEWDFGNGHNSIKEIPVSQTYQQGISDTSYFILLKATNQCGISLFNDSVTVYPKPKVQFGMSQKYGCSPVAITFLDGITGFPDTMIWNFGDGSPSVTSSKFNKETKHTFSYKGDTDTLYTITLHALNECAVDSTKQQVTIHSNTVNAFFTIDTLAGCEPLTEHFVNHSGNITSAWDFGDGTLSTEHDPVYTFTKAGTYVVRLAVNNGCSYDTTKSIPIVVYPNPLPKFTFTDSVCAKSPVSFKNLTTNINGLSWDFGDGSPQSILPKPSHSYNSYGIFNAILTVENSNGCKASQEKSVYIRFTPQSSFTPIPTIGCSPLLVNFTNTTDSLTYNTYIWNMNNGSSSVSLNPPSKTFTNSSYCHDSIFTVTLIANNANCIDTSSSQITVHPKPLSDFKTDDDVYCSFGSQSKVMFKQQSQCANDFEWSIDGTVVSNNINAEYTFTDVKNYIVSLIATNQYLCKDSIIKPYTLYPDPDSIIKIGQAKGCEPLEVLFNATQSNLLYKWEFGDGASSTLFDPSHIYQNEGTYSVDVTITSKQGCSTNLSKKNSIHVYPQSHADFLYEEPNLDNNDGSFRFTNISTNASSYKWILGDGTYSNSSDTILHRYWTNNSINVILIANNSYNCPDTASKSIQPKFFSGLFIPNALSPTNPNDSIKYFRPIGIGLKSFHIQVYDTWGNLIWESTALDVDGRPTEYWDGKSKKGEDLPMDAFVWKTDNCIFNDGRRWEGMKYGNRYKNTGTVTVIR